MIAAFYDTLTWAVAASWSKIVDGHRWVYDHSVGYLYEYTVVRGIVFAFGLDAIVIVLAASVASSIGY